MKSIRMRTTLTRRLRLEGLAAAMILLSGCAGNRPPDVDKVYPDLLPHAEDCPFGNGSSTGYDVLFTVENKGLGSAGPFTISVTSGGVTVPGRMEHGLGAGKSSQRKAHITKPFPQHVPSYEIVVDSHDEVFETDETNNRIKGVCQE